MLALNAILSYNINLISLFKMTIETLRSSISRVDMQRSGDLPVQRVTVVTPAEDKDSGRNLTLQIDGKQIRISIGWFYLTGDVLSVIKFAKGLIDSHLIYPLIKDAVDSEAVKAEKINHGRRMIYKFSREGLIELTEILLPQLDPIVSLPKEPVVLPGNHILDNLTARQKQLMILFLKKKESKQKAVTESDFATLYPCTRAPDKTVSRARRTIHELRMLLKDYGWMIENRTEHPASVNGTPSEYELLSPEDIKTKMDQKPLTEIRIPYPDSPKKVNLKPEAMTIHQERLTSAREQLGSACADSVLSILRINGNLRGVKKDLKKLLETQLPRNAYPYRFSLSDIIPSEKDKPYLESLQKFFINCLRKKLRQAVTPKPNEYFLNRRIGTVAADKKSENKDNEEEKIIKAVCDHFGIKYEEPSNPSTSSPAS